MDYIKKTICIDDARTRTQGLVPYYEFGKEYTNQYSGDCGDIIDLGLEIASGSNGNWGNFPANPCFLSSCGKTYEDMLSKYYGVLNIVRDSVKLRKVETKDDETIYTEDIGTFYSDGEDCFVGSGEPEYLYDFASYDADDFTFTEVHGERKETRRIFREITSGTVSEDHMYIVLINDYDKFNGMVSYLDGVDYDELETGVVIEDGDENYKWARMCQVVDACIGKINIPSWIFNKHIKVPKTMPCAEVSGYIEWLEKYQTLSADCCNMRLWDDMGSDDMLNYLKASAETKCEVFSEIINNLLYSVPYIEMPLLLTQTYTDVGVLTNIDGVEYDENTPGPVTDGFSRPHGFMSANTEYENSGLTDDDILSLVCSGVGLTIDEIIMGSGNTRYEYPTTEEFEADSARTFGNSGTTVRPIVVESQLETLRDAKKYIDDKNNVLPGQFEKFSENSAGKMHYCIKGSNERFYRLGITSHTRTIEEEVITYWDVIYESASITDDDIYGLNNLNHTSVPDIEPSWKNLEGDAGRAQAERIVNEQRSTYTNVDKSIDVNQSIYQIRVVDKSWKIAPASGTPIEAHNADGMDSSPVSSGGTLYQPGEFRDATGQFYRTITTCEAGIRIAETEEEETNSEATLNSYYFFFVKYNNSSGTPMTIPYHVGNTANVYLIQSGDTNWLYRGDYIRGITSGETSGKTFIEFVYVIGGRFNGDSAGTYSSPVAGYGDVYYEKYNYEPVHKDLVPLDGVDNVPVWSQYIDFEAAAKEFYSPRYGLYRTGNTANIIEFSSAEQWTAKDGDGDQYSYDAYLTKEDYLTAFSLPPKVDVNVTIDRGGVSVFEKHYKLSECNTMQDLVNYGNRYFFPE